MELTGYGRVWSTMPPEWWDRIYAGRAPYHRAFTEWLGERLPHCSTVLEIGGGAAPYCAKVPGLFSGVHYTGIDISPTAIHACRETEGRTFICADFMEYDFPSTFDLVFSNAVIDHVYSPEEFLLKVARLADRYALVDSYVGYSDRLMEHDRHWDGNKGCFDGRLSPHILCETLGTLLPETQFSVRRGEGDWSNDLLVEINKK